MDKPNDTGVVVIGGKAYKTVAKRIEKFREQHTLVDGWSISTELLDISSDQVVVRATIMNPGGVVVATGHAQETWQSQINRTSAVENCETSAIGRALAAAGFGGSEFASADELARAVEQQKACKTNQPGRGRPIKQPKPDARKMTIESIGRSDLEALQQFDEWLADGAQGKLDQKAIRECQARAVARRAELEAASGELFDRAEEPEGIGV